MVVLNILHMDVNSHADLLPIKKSETEIFNNIKTNIVKIFVNRKFINEKNEENAIKKFIDDKNDDYEYTLILDNESNYNTTIPNKKVHIKFIFDKINSLNKSSPIAQFIQNGNDEYKFIIVNDIQTRINTALETNSIEIYHYRHLKENKVDNINVSKYEILSLEEKKNFLESYRLKDANLSLISSCDMMARFYRLKRGEVVRLVRPSTATCESFYYRLVVYRTELTIKT
jgi:DNA-directed RNA polymerase subunit H (RpoH/RPB5)